MLRDKRERLDGIIERMESHAKQLQQEKTLCPKERAVGKLLLGLDVGTTGAKAFIYDERCFGGGGVTTNCTPE